MKKCIKQNQLENQVYNIAKAISVFENTLVVTKSYIHDEIERVANRYINFYIYICKLTGAVVVTDFKKDYVDTITIEVTIYDNLFYTSLK